MVWSQIPFGQRVSWLTVKRTEPKFRSSKVVRPIIVRCFVIWPKAGRWDNHMALNEMPLTVSTLPTLWIYTFLRSTKRWDRPTLISLVNGSHETRTSFFQTDLLDVSVWSRRVNIQLLSCYKLLKLQYKGTYYTLKLMVNQSKHFITNCLNK